MAAQVSFDVARLRQKMADNVAERVKKGELPERIAGMQTTRIVVFDDDLERPGHAFDWDRLGDLPALFGGRNARE